MIKSSTELSNQQKVFLDTSFFKALIDIHDDFHQEAIIIWGEIKNSPMVLMTTNFILDESFTLIRVKCGLPISLEFRERLAAGLKRIRILRVITDDEAKAWDWFINNWSGLSFTDCTSFAFMKRCGISEVASFDEHFSRAGFKVLG